VEFRRVRLAFDRRLQVRYRFRRPPRTDLDHAELEFDLGRGGIDDGGPRGACPGRFPIAALTLMLGQRQPVVDRPGGVGRHHKKGGRGGLACHRVGAAQSRAHEDTPDVGAGGRHKHGVARGLGRLLDLSVFETGLAEIEHGVDISGYQGEIAQIDLR